VRTHEIKQRPWIEVLHAELIPSMSLSVIERWAEALADEPSPSHDLLLHEINRGIEQMVFGTVGARRGRPPKGVRNE
jgi:hypothetical protein